MNNTVEINKICRLCLADEEVNVRIFDGNAKEEQVYLKISTCLPIQISRDDIFPKKICDDCSDKVNIMYRLWNTSASSEKKLSEWFEQWDANNKNTDSEIIDLTDIGFEPLIDVGLSEIIVKEPCKNAKDKLNQDDFIEELPHCTSLETVEEELCKNTIDLQNDIFDQNVYMKELNEIIEEEPCENTTDTQDLQNDSLNQDVSIEELPHSTTLEIVYSNTPEERLEDGQEDIWEQELEFSSAELPSSTTLETISNETVAEVQPITTCIVPTCDGNENNTKKIFHPLPSNEEIRNIWLKLISRSDLLEKPYQDLQQARVCGAHFDEAQYFSRTKKFHCIVANCDGITNNKRRTWHSVPKDYELREKWLLTLKRPDLQDSTSALKVCSAHFASWQFRSPVSETLNFRSVPLFIKDEQETSNATTSPPVILPKQPPTPTKQPVAASTQNATPGKQPPTAKKEFENPFKRLSTTPKQNATSRNQLITTEKRLAATPKQNATSAKQLATSKKRFATMPKQNAAPGKLLITLKKEFGNPTKRLATTPKRNATPGKQLATSRKRLGNLTKRLATTPKQNATPRKQLTTSKTRLGNSAKRLATTPKQNATSGKHLSISAKRRYSLRKFHIPLEIDE